jgi:hypothetical protein
MLKRILSLFESKKTEISKPLSTESVPESSHLDPNDTNGLVAFVCAQYENDAYVKRETLSNSITKIGVSEFIATKITSLVPEAYAKLVLESMGTTPSDLAIFIEQSTKNELEIKLSEDEIFSEALKIARATYRKSPEITKRVASRGSSLRAVNTALAHGSKPANVVPSPTMIVVQKLN